MATMIKCPFCGGLADASSTNCLQCGGPLQSKASPARVSRTQAQCPACQAPLGPGDIVCVKCGVNLLTGQKITMQEPKKTSPGFKRIARIFVYVLVGGVLVVALGLGATLLVYFFRNPVNEARKLAVAGNLEQAVAMLQAHLQRSAADVEAQFLLGQIYWQGQQFNKAAEAFESAARQGGAKERDALLLAVLAAERNPDNTIRKRLLSLLETVVPQRHAGDNELLLLLGLLQGMDGNYKGQRQSFQEALLLSGDVPPALPGVAWALEKDIESAERSLEKARVANPNHPQVLLAQAVLTYRKQDYQRAVELLETINDVPERLDSLLKLFLGMMYMYKDEDGKALAFLSDAKRLRPDDERALFFHALCLQENKLFEEALAAYDSLLQRKGPYAGLAALQMAMAFMDSGNLERASVMARQASELGVNTARQAVVQGRIYALQNDWVQAEQSYRRAISITADYPAARLELGLLLVYRGSIETGLRELETYLQLAESDPQRLRKNEIELLVNQIKQSQKK